MVTQNSQSNSNTENILISVQDHWVLFLPSLLMFFFGAGIFLLFWQIALNLAPNFQVLSAIIFCIGMLFGLVTYHIGFIFIFKWLISRIIITDQNLIIIRYLPFVEDDISYIDIANCHEINKKQHGITKNILNYGEVYVNPGRGNIIQLNYINHPEKFVSIIEAIKLKKPLLERDVKALGADYYLS